MDKELRRVTSKRWIRGQKEESFEAWKKKTEEREKTGSQKCMHYKAHIPLL